MTEIDEDRRRIEELLPFYLNGTLDGDERAEVERALADDESLRFELEFLGAVRDDVKSRDPGQSPGEFGLARLQREIEREGQVSKPGERRNLWRIAAAFAFALFAAQSIWIVSSTGPDVELAGGNGGTVEGTTLIVGFSESATEAQIRMLLLDLELEIVGGPSALGLYSVLVPEGLSVDDTLVALSGATGLVESAEVE